jgi:hypothetical protein
MNVTIVTTFSEKNYKDYGHYFMASLEKYLDENINVVIYTDSPLFDDTETWKNLILAETSPNLVKFKERNKDRKVPSGTKGFLFDAVRFSHKSYCIIHASRNCKTDRLIWLDADTEILAPITNDYLNSHLDNKMFVSYLGRPDRYTETGWLAFDITNKNTTSFFDKWEWYYNTDEIYNLPAQLDCHVFDAVKDEFIEKRLIEGQNISPPNIGKAHFDTRFKNFMCHYKGNRKESRDLYFKKAIRKK